MKNKSKIGQVKRVAVIGAGLMGSGIGQTFAQAGLSVFLCDLSEDQLQKALLQIRANLIELSDHGLIDKSKMENTLKRIRTTLSLEEAAIEADFVIEAIHEELSAKQTIFQTLDKICLDGTILGSNTSFFKPSELVVNTHHPERILVSHFFYPPHLIPLVEIVPGSLTSEAARLATWNVMKFIGKTPILLKKEAPGFVANRLQLALMREALHIVDEGIASPEDVDMAVKNSFGRRLAVAGPFELREIQSAWDSTLASMASLFRELCSSNGISPFVKERVAKKELGSKTGKGVYSWTPGNVGEWKERMNENLIHFLVADSKKKPKAR